MQGGDALVACDAHAQQLLPADNIPDTLPRKLDSKPCKRIGKIVRAAEKPVTILVIATTPAPALPEAVAPIWSALSEIPIESLLLRRSGISRAPPAFA